MKDFDSSLVHSSWLPVFEPLAQEINQILSRLDPENVAPRYEDIFRAFQTPLSKVSCVIIGQDPYPTRGHAHGLAFSVEQSVSPLPKSLQNIFKELHDDIGNEIPESGDLFSWSSQGVLLLNRVLTTEVGIPNAHVNLGWQNVTDAISRTLGAQNVVAILWGRNAQELSGYFRYRIESAHPSPLSSYRGFFGSKPFSRANELLRQLGREEISW